MIDNQVLQAAATTGNGNEYDLGGHNRLVTFYLTGIGTTSGGTITYETADSPGYSGTWAPLASAVNASDVSSNKQKITQVNGPLRYIRARISSDITGGGSINVSVVAN